MPRIDALMAEQGRKVGWLCTQTGIGYSAMRRRRQEPSTFTLNELEAIAAALGINTTALLDGQVPA